MPLAVRLTGANRNDSQEALALVDAIPALHGERGVAWATDQEPEDVLPMTVCWRRPARKRCRGELIAELQRSSSEIFWHCPMCGVNGVIRGWEHSL